MKSITYLEILKLAYMEQLRVVERWTKELKQSPNSKIAKYHCTAENKKLDEIRGALIAREKMGY
ncbi:MAG: hypothetical protein ACLRQ0_14190 [Monoglobales bacterium]